ncbi:hypothetical protein EV1_022994 [Malus domestica]
MTSIFVFVFFAPSILQLVGKNGRHRFSASSAATNPTVKSSRR